MTAEKPKPSPEEMSKIHEEALGRKADVEHLSSWAEISEQEASDNFDEMVGKLREINAQIEDEVHRLEFFENYIRNQSRAITEGHLLSSNPYEPGGKDYSDFEAESGEDEDYKYGGRLDADIDRTRASIEKLRKKSEEVLETLDMMKAPRSR